MKSNVLRFDYWFSFNYKRLRSILGWQLNEDVFHDTYLLLRKDLLFIDLPIIDFEPLFWGIYKRARLRNIAKENRYYRPNEIFFHRPRPVGGGAAFLHPFSAVGCIGGQ